MLKTPFAHSAMGGKVHAKLGGRLTADDFRVLAGMRSIVEVADFLRDSAAWGGALDTVRQEDVHRGILEAALTRQLVDEYVCLLRFSAGSVKRLIAAYITAAEINEILRLLRCLGAGRGDDFEPRLPEHFLTRGRFKYEKLKDKTYAGLLEAARGGSFFAPLDRHAPKDGGEPDYTTIETALRAVYYRELERTIEAHFSRAEAAELLGFIGVRGDYLNMINIYRAKQYFHVPPDRLWRYALPVRGRLSGKDLRALIVTPDGEDMLRLLRAGPYGGPFSRPFGSIEQVYYREMLRMSAKVLHRGLPGALTAIAYFVLIEVECKNLTTLVECVRYGLPVPRTMELLILD